MNTVILAAGSGNRLQPLTNKIPKCLLEVGGKSLLSWQLDSLSLAGVKNINLVAGHKYKKIIDLKENRIRKIIINENYLKNNMVKSLLYAKDLFVEDLLISYSDIVYSSEIPSLLINANYENAIIVDLDWLKLWSQRFKNPLEDAETLIFDDNFNLIEIGQKSKNITHIMAQYIGLLKFNKKTLNFILSLDSKNLLNDKMYMTDLITILLQSNINIKVIPIKRGWFEVDSIQDLELYQKQIMKIKKESIFSILK